MSKTRTRLAAGAIGIGAMASLVAMLPKLEGTILRGYRDPIGIVTACVGHTRTAVLGRPYTAVECDRLLRSDLAVHAAGVAACVAVPLTQNEQAAYISLAFNIGVGAFCRSTLVARLNRYEYGAACAEISKWNKAGGRVLPGLVRRRAIERALCEAM